MSLAVDVVQAMSGVWITLLDIMGEGTLITPKVRSHGKGPALSLQAGGVQDRVRSA